LARSLRGSRAAAARPARASGPGVGAGLQLLIVGLAALRGLRARSLAGATIAVALLLLVTRFSLSLLEGYYSAPAFGLLLGFALALPGGRDTTRLDQTSRVAQAPTGRSS